MMDLFHYIVDRFGHELVALYILTLGIGLSCFTLTQAVGHDLVAAGLIALKLTPPTQGTVDKAQDQTEKEK